MFKCIKCKKEELHQEVAFLRPLKYCSECFLKLDDFRTQILLGKLTPRWIRKHPNYRIPAMQGKFLDNFKCRQ